MVVSRWILALEGRWRICVHLARRLAYKGGWLEPLHEHAKPLLVVYIDCVCRVRSISQTFGITSSPI